MMWGKGNQMPGIPAWRGLLNLAHILFDLMQGCAAPAMLVPLEKHITDDMPNALGINQFRVDDDVTLLADFCSATNASVKRGAESCLIESIRGHFENDTAPLSKSGESFLLPIRAGSVCVGKSEQLTVVRISRNFGDKFGRCWKPAAFAFIIIFIEIIGNFFYQAFTRRWRDDVKYDGASGAQRRGVGNQPLVEDGCGSGGGHAGGGSS